jgi:hypothetical protein
MFFSSRDDEVVRIVFGRLLCVGAHSTRREARILQTRSPRAARGGDCSSAARGSAAGLRPADEAGPDDGTRGLSRFRPDGARDELGRRSAATARHGRHPRGLITSTLLTLFVLPTVHTLFSRARTADDRRDEQAAVLPPAGAHDDHRDDPEGGDTAIRETARSSADQSRWSAAYGRGLGVRTPYSAAGPGTADDGMAVFEQATYAWEDEGWAVRGCQQGTVVPM